MEWLSADGVTPRRDAAARKLRWSATETNAVKLASSARSIPEFRSAQYEVDIRFSFVLSISTLVPDEFGCRRMFYAHRCDIGRSATVETRHPPEATGRPGRLACSARGG